MLLLLLVWVVSVYSIEIYNETYSCDLSVHHVVVHVPLRFNFSKSCEEEWTKLPEKIPIASVATHSKLQCHRPCVQVSHRELILSECSKVQLTVVCGDGIKILEKRIDFQGKEARLATKEENSSNHTCFSSILLLPMAVIFAYINQRC